MKDNEMDKDTRDALTYEQLAFAFLEMPITIDSADADRYSGPPDKRLAFETAEAMGTEGSEALFRFAELVVKCAKLQGGRTSRPSGTGDLVPSSMRLEDLVEGRRERKINEMIADHPLSSEVFREANDTTGEEVS